jgi:hypothetical protein
MKRSLVAWVSNWGDGIALAEGLFNWRGIILAEDLGEANLQYKVECFYFIYVYVVHLTMLFQWPKLHSIKWNGDKWIGKDLEGSGHGLILRCYPKIFLEELRKIMKILSQDSRSLGKDLKPGPADKIKTFGINLLLYS